MNAAIITNSANVITTDKMSHAFFKSSIKWMFSINGKQRLNTFATALKISTQHSIFKIIKAYLSMNKRETRFFVL